MVTGPKDSACVRGVDERAVDGRAAGSGRGIELGAAECRAVGDGGRVGPGDSRRGRSHVGVHRGGRVRVAGIVRGEEDLQGVAVAGTEDGARGRGVGEVARNAGRGIELGAAECRAVGDGGGVGPGDGRDVKHLDVGSGRAGCIHRQGRASAGIGREVAGGAVRVAAVYVGPAVVVERNDVVVVWEDGQHIRTVVVRAGPNAQRARVGGDIDAREGCTIESGDGAADGHAGRHPDVLDAYVGVCHMNRRAVALLIGREVAPGDIGVVAAAEVMAGVVGEVQGVVAVWRDRQ